MKITIIHGQNHEGSTCMVARELAEKTVVLLGRDFERFGNLHEYYDPFSGEPALNLGFTNWNLLVLNMIAWLDGKECVNEF